MIRLQLNVFVILYNVNNAKLYGLFSGEMDFGRREWARSRDAVDAVMELLQNELRVKAVNYEHLRIDSYIRQGSSRDGLKVVAPDEFDTHIEF